MDEITEENEITIAQLRRQLSKCNGALAANAAASERINERLAFLETQNAIVETNNLEMKESLSNMKKIGNSLETTITR